MNRTRGIFSILLSAVILFSFFTFDAAAAEPSNAITVSIMVIGDSKHAVGEHSQYQVWIDRTYYSVQDGTKADTILLRALKANGMQYKYSGGYLSSINAPAILGGDRLSDGYSGKNGNGMNSGWWVSTNKSGYHETLSVGMGQYRLSDGEFIIVHYVDDYNTEFGLGVWPNPPLPDSWLSAAPLPEGGSSGPDGDGGGTTSGGGGSPISGWIDSLFQSSKEYKASDLTKIKDTNNYRLLVKNNSFIKSDELKNLPKDASLYADMAEDSKIKFRLIIPSPATLSGDIYLALSYEAAQGSITSLFNSNFSNNVKVLTFEQKNPWNQMVDVIVSADTVPNFNKDTSVLYSYNTDNNTYDKIPYWVDENNHIHFKVEGIYPIVFSDKALVKK